MNLRAIANRATSAINPNLLATVKRANGTTQLPDYSRVPNYDALDAIIQVQALTVKDVEHLNSMNIAISDIACYCNIQLVANDRKTQSGGDLVIFTDPSTGISNTWLVTASLEGWIVAGWSRVALTKQIDA